MKDQNAAKTFYLVSVELKKWLKFGIFDTFEKIRMKDDPIISWN